MAGVNAQSGGQSKKPVSIRGLKLLDIYTVPFNMPFDGTVIGGLSGVDYDPVKKLYYFISDDRSQFSAARYYAASIAIKDNHIDTVAFTKVVKLLDAGGHTYPSSAVDPYHTPDPEALRLDPLRRQMLWTSEGERIVRKDKVVLENPRITIMNEDGSYLDTLLIPDCLRMHQEELGPRQNSTLEGLGFWNNYRDVFVSVEEPLYEDGPRADIHRNNAWIRILKFNRSSRKNIAQYAYHLEPVAHPATPESGYKINGISDLLMIGPEKCMVIERSFSVGREACTIRVFKVDLSRAQNIRSIPSLKKQPPVRPALKKLLINMDNLGVYIDNVEGMTFGPTLPNGHQSMIFVSDNNFSPFQKTQILLFEVIP